MGVRSASTMWTSVIAVSSSFSVVIGSGERSVDMTVAAVPVRCAQFFPQDLPGGIAWQDIGPLHARRALEGRQALAAVIDQFLGSRVGTVVQHHDRLRGFAPLVVRA